MPRIFPAIAAAILAAVSVAAPASAVPTPVTSTIVATAELAAQHQRNDVAANKALVTYFYDQLFKARNLSVIDSHIGPVYIQHNPRLADGAEALRQFVLNQGPPVPGSSNTTVRVVAQRDLVLLHRHSVSTPGALGTAATDVFRVRDGKIIEHWDVLQPVPPTTASGNDMFATLSTTGDRSTARNERIVLSFFHRLTARHDLTAVDRYVSPNLIQHDPLVANGSAAVKDTFAASLRESPQLSFKSLQVIADRDLVSLRYHRQKTPADLGQAVNDIYRVGNGKIVEQWRVVQNVPATSANDNTMF